MSTNGKILQIIGPVVDVQFAEEAIPAIYQAITINYTIDGEEIKLTLEVQQHLGAGKVRAVAMSSTEGLKRGMEVIDTGAAISVPVGRGVLGRIFNVTGDPVDERGPIPHEKRYPIHRPAPPLTELRMLTWLGLTILLEHSLYSSAMELFFMITEPPRLSKRLLEGDAASAFCMPLDYLFLTLVIMRRSGEKGLIGEGGSTELR